MALARKDIGTGWDRNNRNAINDNFKELYDEFRDAGLNAKEAKNKAEEALRTQKNIKEIAERAEKTSHEANSSVRTALDVSEQAKNQSERTEKELSQAILEGDSSPLGGQLSVGHDGTVYDNPQERLIKENELIEKKLIDKANQSVVSEVITKQSLIDFERFGLLKLPADFPKGVPFDLYREYPSGQYKHSFNFDSLKGSSHNTVYIDYINGHGSYDGLSPDRAARRFPQAMDIANSLPETTITIEFIHNIFPYTEFDAKFSYVLEKNIIIKASQGELFIPSAYRATTQGWVADGNAYKANRTSTEMVIDVSKKDYKGEFLELEKVNSISEVKNKKGTWYTDGTTVWVRRTDDSVIDDNISLLLPLGNTLSFEITGKTMFLDNVHFLYKTSKGNSFSVASSVAGGGYLYHRNCTFAYGYVHGLATTRIEGVYGFNSRAYRNGYDGFNYHGKLSEKPYEFVFEYYCQAHNNGDVIKSTGNATTAHDGMTVLRICSLGYDCWGPVLADVNGCYSVNVGCTMYDSLRSDNQTKSAFYFDDSGSVKKGKAFLIDCEGGGNDTFSFNTDGIIDLNVKNFKGNNIPNNVPIKVID